MMQERQQDQLENRVRQCGSQCSPALASMRVGIVKSTTEAVAPAADEEVPLVAPPPRRRHRHRVFARDSVAEELFCPYDVITDEFVEAWRVTACESIVVTCMIANLVMYEATARCFPRLYPVNVETPPPTETPVKTAALPLVVCARYFYVKTAALPLVVCARYFYTWSLGIDRVVGEVTVSRLVMLCAIARLLHANFQVGPHTR